MKSGTGVRRRAAIVGAGLGALTLLSAGQAPAFADEMQSKEWYLDAMEAQALWKVSTGKGVAVAVIDTGVNPDTGSLKGQVILPGVDVTGKAGGATEDSDGHGTSMAELIAGTGKSGGIKGIAPGAEIIPIRTPIGKEVAKKGELLSKAIRAAADSDAKIINISSGSNYAAPGGLEAVQYARSKGKLIFASVGNDAQDVNDIDYPAQYPGVVGIGATDENGRVAKFSEHGEEVDLASPGVDMPVWCDGTFTSYCVHSTGTSQAAALASGAAALIWSAHPDWTANQVLRVMIDTAGRDWPKKAPSDYLGYGTIRPAQVLLKGKGDPGPADIDPISNKKTPGLSSGSESGASPSASAADATHDSKTTSDGKTSAAESGSGSGNTTLWVALGAVAAVAAAAGAGFAVVRSRRRA